MRLRMEVCDRQRRMGNRPLPSTISQGWAGFFRALEYGEGVFDRILAN